MHRFVPAVVLAIACWGLLLTQRATAEGLQPSAHPINGEPQRCWNPGEDTYCLIGTTIVALQTGKTVLTLHPGGTVAQLVCDVGPNAAAACLYIDTRTEGSQQQTRTRVRLMQAFGHSIDGVLAEGFAEAGFEADALGIYSRPGHFARAWSVRQPSQPSHDYVADGMVVTEAALPSSSWGERLIEATSLRKQPPVEFFELQGALWVVGRDGRDLQVARFAPQLKWTKIAQDSMYDWRSIAAADGWVYVFFHDTVADTMNVATSNDGVTWKTIELDTKESGWQLDAAPVGYGVVATWYYLRTTYNKGLRTGFLRNGSLLQEANTVVRRDDRNAGFYPHLGVTRDGTTWVSWWDDVEHQTRVWAQLSSPLDLAEVPLRDLGNWNDRYKFWYLQVGGGGWYTLWHALDLRLQTKDTGGIKVGTAQRTLGDTLLLTGSFEARLWSTQLALGYAQSIVDSANRAAGGKLGNLLGSLRFDDLFLGHDIQVRGTFGHYVGFAKPGDNGDDDKRGRLKIDTDYWAAEALALNKWRIKYGVSYARYALPLTYHAFFAAPGSTSYAYAGSYFRDTQIDEVRLLIGYSKLDYAARYENHYSDFVIDADLVIGAGFLKFDKVRPMRGGASAYVVEGSAGLHIDLGWLWMSRVRALAGLGIYVRPLYRCDADALYGGDKPSDRGANDSKGSDSSLGASLISIRHGPWLDVGIVW